MLGSVKSWLVNHVWNAFSMDKWKKRSQTFSVMVGVAFVLSIIALLVAIMTNFNHRRWTDSGAVVLVPKKSVVTINGAAYIPIRMVE